MGHIFGEKNLKHFFGTLFIGELFWVHFLGHFFLHIFGTPFVSAGRNIFQRGGAKMTIHGAGRAKVKIWSPGAEGHFGPKWALLGPR